MGETVELYYVGRDISEAFAYGSNVVSKITTLGEAESVRAEWEQSLRNRNPPDPDTSPVRIFCLREVSAPAPIE